MDVKKQRTENGHSMLVYKVFHGEPFTKHPAIGDIDHLQGKTLGREIRGHFCSETGENWSKIARRCIKI